MDIHLKYGKSILQAAGAASAIVAMLSFAPTANAAPLLANGDFETGTFAGWSVVDLADGSGSWFISTPGADSPISGFSTAPNPAGGNFYAVTDQSGPGTHALIQAFTVAPGVTSAVLTFQMFANDQSDAAPIIDPAGLTHLGNPNQHARVDLLSGSAQAFDTGAGVLATFYLGDDSGANPNPYTSYSFDITSLLAPGGSFQLRFAEVDNLFFYQVGVDNVQIDVSSVPEPTSLVLLITAVTCAGLSKRRKSAS